MPANAHDAMNDRYSRVASLCWLAVAVGILLVIAAAAWLFFVWFNTLEMFGRRIPRPQVTWQTARGPVLMSSTGVLTVAIALLVAVRNAIRPRRVHR